MTQTNGVVSLNLFCELVAIWGLELVSEFVADFLSQGFVKLTCQLFATNAMFFLTKLKKDDKTALNLNFHQAGLRCRVQALMGPCFYSSNLFGVVLKNYQLGIL